MHRLRFLVVGDSKVGRLTMQKKLESIGIGVDLAESGLEALSYFEQHRPDIIFMDHMMPELDGFEATRRINSNPATRDIPVIFISGSDDEAFVRDARAIGADGAITKPHTTQAIERILATLPRAGTAPVEAASTSPPPSSASPTLPAAAPRSSRPPSADRASAWTGPGTATQRAAGKGPCGMGGGARLGPPESAPVV